MRHFETLKEQTRTVTLQKGISDGYGKVGLSSLSTNHGMHEISPTTFSMHATYIYKQMYYFYNEQQCLTRQCVENLYDMQGKGKYSEGYLNVDAIFDGTWLTSDH